MRRRKVVAFDHGDQLPGLDILPLFDGQRLDAARYFGADLHFIGIHGADQVQIARRPGRQQGTRPAIPP